MKVYRLGVKLDNGDRISMSDVPFEDNRKCLSISGIDFYGDAEIFEKIFNVIKEGLNNEKN